MRDLLAAEPLRKSQIKGNKVWEAEEDKQHPQGPPASRPVGGLRTLRILRENVSASSGSAPPAAGHGGGKPLAKVLEEQADIYSFILYNMGLEY